MQYFQAVQKGKQRASKKQKDKERSSQFLEVVEIPLKEQEQVFHKKLQKSKKLLGKISTLEFLEI